MKDGPRRLPSWLGPAATGAAIITAFALWSKHTLTSDPGAAAAAARASAPDLAGSVKSAEGLALTNATIFISLAQPRKGPGFT